MRHRKRSLKLGRTTSHNRCMIANMLKSLIDEERIVTTVAKAKEIRRHADRVITLAKKNSLASRRHAVGKLMIRYNSLTGKEARQLKDGNTSVCNTDRQVINKLFNVLGPRFELRNGGYTRIIRGENRIGDNAHTCVLEFLSD